MGDMSQSNQRAIGVSYAPQDLRHACAKDTLQQVEMNLLMVHPSLAMMAPNLVAQSFPLLCMPHNALMISMVWPSNSPNSGPAVSESREISR